MVIRSNYLSRVGWTLPVYLKWSGFIKDTWSGPDSTCKPREGSIPPANLEWAGFCQHPHRMDYTQPIYVVLSGLYQQKWEWARFYQFA
jgi:hypothetical protein